ncbi:MAG: AMP-binding protein [Lachnospiraceae bacterium]|nr:AMP-binding protein [Lachnospiraceae bacterium]
MRLAFSTRNVRLGSFLELCNIARDYGFDGFEVDDVQTERQLHQDSLFRSGSASDARRKLRNRGISVSALNCAAPLDGDITEQEILRLLDIALFAGVETLIVRSDFSEDAEMLRAKLGQALKKAEDTGVEILFETSGPFSDSEKLISLINAFGSTAIGAAWDVRKTCFTAKESVQTTIKTLGAYIRYVRLGDMKEGKKVLLGDGELQVKDFLNALRALNYEGFVCASWNDEIDDPDIVLTHFASFLRRIKPEEQPQPTLYYNRAKTGTFPWRKYETVDLTFSQVLDTMAEIYPDQYAFKYTTLEYTRTYAEFRRDVDRMAASLIALGVKPGYHVAIWATNVPSWFLTFWAATKIGAVLVTVNTAYKVHEIEYLLQQSDTHTLVMIESSKDANYREIINELCPELKGHEPGRPLYSKKLPFLRNVITDGFTMDGALTWEEMMLLSDTIPMEEVRRRASLVRPDDVCNMQYTSGTTGFPKGVMLTHRNIINDGKIIGDRMDLSTADRMMIQVPMFHCFGMVLSMTSMMTHGGTLSPIPYFSPKSSLACITQERITCFNGVPTMFIAMFSHPDFEKTDFSYLRTGIMAGSNCPPDLMRRASVEMNMREIISVYGQTEASPGCTMGEVNEDLDHRVETVGSAFPGVECMIIDPETGLELPDGENGEFVARGFNIMKGYYKMPEATAEVIDKDGWLHSGDICCRTEDGYYKVTGRLKDMIIRGGENIYPREIEEFYLTNPKVKDVQVIGVKDERYGEEACAWVVLHENETADTKEMQQYGNERIARHKVPRYFFFVEDFPMNAAGKILKYRMKEISEEKLGVK